MSLQRRPIVVALVLTLIVLTLSVGAWGVLGAFSNAAHAGALSVTAHRYLVNMLVVITVCAWMLALATLALLGQRQLGARLDEIHARIDAQDDITGGYAAGYADGLAAGKARANGARPVALTQIPPRGSTRS